MIVRILERLLGWYRRKLHLAAAWYLGKRPSALPGIFAFVCRNPDGTIAWEERAGNGTATAGLNDMLNVYFGSGTQKTTWFIGLIDNASFSSLSPNDTMASHGGWIENVAFTQTTRPAWGPGSASGGSISNATAVTFSMNASATIKGAFLASDSTLSGTGGLLWSSGIFSSNQVMTSGQTLSVTYTAPLTAQ